METLEAIVENLVNGENQRVSELVQKALDEGIGVGEILNEGLIAGMNFVGGRFRTKELFLPEVLFAARAMHGAMDILEPLLVGEGIEPIGEVALGSVKGDVHDIGKNLVGMMLRGAGFSVTDLGIDVPPEKFVEAAQQDFQVIGLSALISTTMEAMRSTIDALAEAGVKGKVKTIIGGAIVTPSFADDIGADAYAPDAFSAVGEIKQLLGLK